MIGYIIGGAVILFIIILAVSGKFRQATHANIKKIGDDVADKYSDPIAEAELLIDKSSKEVATYKTKVAAAMAQNKRVENEITIAELNVEKCEKIARKAGHMGNSQDVEIALLEKANHKETVKALKLQKEANDKILGEQKDEIRKLEREIKGAKSQLSILEAQHTSNNLRKDMAKSKAGIGKKNSLSKIDDLKERVANDEAEINAMTELADQTATLKQKYNDSDKISKEDIASYMNNEE